MPKIIVLEPHLTKEELHKRYRACSKPNEKLRWKALFLIASGTRAAEAARRVGRSSAWITKVTARYNQKGATAVADKAAASARGKTPTLNQELALELDAALHRDAPDGGLWTANKVADWIAAKTGRRLHKPERVADLRALGFTVQTARPRARTSGNGGRTSGLEKKLIEQVAALEQQSSAQTVEVWAMDEARIGLQPVLRRVWAKRRRRPTAVVAPHYEWLWLYAAVHPASGRVFWLILPRLNRSSVAIFLREFASAHASSADKQVVLVWDGAPLASGGRIEVAAEPHASAVAAVHAGAKPGGAIMVEGERSGGEQKPPNARRVGRPSSRAVQTSRQRKKAHQVNDALLLVGL